MPTTKTTRKLPADLVEYVNNNAVNIYVQEFKHYIKIGVYLAGYFICNDVETPFDMSRVSVLAMRDFITLNNKPVTAEQLAWAVYIHKSLYNTEQNTETTHADVIQVLEKFEADLSVEAEKIQTKTTKAKRKPIRTTTQKIKTKARDQKHKSIRTTTQKIQTKARDQKHKSENHQIGATFRNEQIDAALDYLRDNIKNLDDRTEFFYSVTEQVEKLTDDEVDELMSKYPTTKQNQKKVQMSGVAPKTSQRIKQAALLRIWERTNNNTAEKFA